MGEALTEVAAPTGAAAPVVEALTAAAASTAAVAPVGEALMQAAASTAAGTLASALADILPAALAAEGVCRLLTWTGGM
jgi:hypothetical protein